MKKHYLFLLLSIGFMTSALSQTTLSGNVVSKIDGTPIPGATIVPNNATQDGVATDFDGNFSMDLKQSTGTIKISFIGFNTIELPYSGNQTFQIEMDEQATSLDEIVLIGYGSTKKGDVVTAVATVEGIETMSSRPVASLNDFLQGNIPGVTVSQQGGSPTSGGKIIIRGIGSFNDAGVLMVVDGMIYNGPSINPNDIESVSVLKDAAAAAIYGAQASAGVIVIQTKKGKLGKPQITVDAYSGVQQASNLPTALNARQQADTYNLAAFNSGSPKQSAHDATQNPWGQTTRTNWMDEIFRTAAINSVNLNVSGATEMVNYMTSFGYFKKDGVLLGTNTERYSFRVKSDYMLTEKLKVGENVYFSQTEGRGTNTSSGYSGTITNAIYMPSAAPVYDEFGQFHGVVPYDLANFAGAYGDVYNPVSLLLRPNISSPYTYLNANVFLEYEIIDGLKFKTSYAYTYSQSNYKKFSPKRPELGRTDLTNSLSQSSSNNTSWIWDNQLTYAKSFGDHNINATAIYSAQFNRWEGFSVYGEGFSSEAPANQYIKNATTFGSPDSWAGETALLSMIGRATYDYKNKYFVTGSIRRDESSKLHPDNQVDFFPSASVGWKISNESFFNVKAIDDLKFRASWGEIGNMGPIGTYSFDVPLYSNNSNIGEDGLDNDKGVYAGKSSNPDLLWERQESLNFGLDATLLDYRLTITADYFIKKTIGMVLGGQEDKHQGTGAADVNAGEVENTGFEFAISYKDAIGDLNYIIRANAFQLNNKLVNLDGYSGSGLDFVTHGDDVRDVLEPFRTQVGRELYTNYLIPYLGIFQSQAEIDAHSSNGNLIQPNALPGDFKFQDTNNDGKIDNNDKVYMESYQPDFTYSFGANLDYKGFDLNFNFFGVSGVKVFNGYKFMALNAGLQGYNLDNRILNAWTPTNTDTDIPRISTKDNNNNFGNTSSWYLEDASYLRLKNVTIGYSLPKDILKNSSLRIYLSAENLFTITDYSGLDPEVGGKGLDKAQYPVAKTFSVGLSLKL